MKAIEWNKKHPKKQPVILTEDKNYNKDTLSPLLNPIIKDEKCNVCGKKGKLNAYLICQDCIIKSNKESIDNLSERVAEIEALLNI